MLYTIYYILYFFVNTGSGKTTLLSQISLDFAMMGIPTLWGSFEIKNVRLLQKMLGQYNGFINYKHEMVPTGTTNSGLGSSGLGSMGMMNSTIVSADTANTNTNTNTNTTNTQIDTDGHGTNTDDKDGKDTLKKELDLQQREKLELIADDFEQLPFQFLNFHGGSSLDEVLDAIDYAVYKYDIQHIILDNLQVC